MRRPLACDCLWSIDSPQCSLLLPCDIHCAPEMIPEASGLLGAELRRIEVEFMVFPSLSSAWLDSGQWDCIPAGLLCCWFSIYTCAAMCIAMRVPQQGGRQKMSRSGRTKKPGPLIREDQEAGRFVVSAVMRGSVWRGREQLGARRSWRDPLPAGCACSATRVQGWPDEQRAHERTGTSCTLDENARG